MFLPKRTEVAAQQVGYSARIREVRQMESTGQFSTELTVFERHRQEWSRLHPGEFVVIRGEEVADQFFGSYTDALKAGLQRFGVQRPFLVKQVWITEPVYCIS